MIHVYPVGTLSSILHAWRYLTLPTSRFSGPGRSPVTRRWRISRAATEARNVRRTITRHIRDRNWRALKNTFNGYLAEPEDWPAGLTRCGTGWTRRRALLSLRNRAAREMQPTSGDRPTLIVDINTMLTKGTRR